MGLGYAAWSDRGGIVARGVLVDYVRYAEKKQISYDPLGSHAISLREIQDIIAEEHLDIRQGDVLIVRCGLSKYVRQAGPEDRSPFDSKVHVGVDPNPELLEWLWNQNVAAVAGDAVSFEAVPASDGSCKHIQWHR
jgi:kynurenine formamidase